MPLFLLLACIPDPPEAQALAGGHADWEGCEPLGEGGCATGGLLSVTPTGEPRTWAFEANGERGTIRTPAGADLSVFDGVEGSVSVSVIDDYGILAELRSDTDYWLMDLGRGLGTVFRLYDDAGGVAYGRELGTSEVDGETLTWHELTFEGDAGHISAAPGVPAKLVRREQTWEVIVVAGYSTGVPNVVDIEPEACTGVVPMLAYEIRRVPDDWEPDGTRIEPLAEASFPVVRCGEALAD